MLSRAVPFTRVAARSFTRPVVGSRAFTATIEDASTAADAAALSGYSDIDFVISDDLPVIDAVQRFAAYNIGCLVTTDSAGKSLKPYPRELATFSVEILTYFVSVSGVFCLSQEISLVSSLNVTTLPRLLYWVALPKKL